MAEVQDNSARHSIAGVRRAVEIVLLVTGSAAFYAATMILMKHWGAVPPVAMALLIAVAFALGSWCEIEALRTERLSAIYVAILGIECVIIAVASFLFLGETMSVREMAGAGLIVVGVSLTFV
ncbi:MAG: EamA family transporter [Pseudomonadota bacterium]